MIAIPLPNGMVTIIDEADASKAAGYGWYAVKGRHTYYARAHDPVAWNKLHLHRKVYLHRLLLNNPAGETDHEDQNGLNNTRSNIRAVTNSINRANSKLYKNNKTGFRGVQIADSGKYQASLTRDSRCTHLGTFDTPEEASRAYQKQTKRSKK